MGTRTGLAGSAAAACLLVGLLIGASGLAEAQVLLPHNNLQGYGPPYVLDRGVAPDINTPRLWPRVQPQAQRYPQYGEGYLRPPTGARFPWLQPGASSEAGHFGAWQPRLLPGRSYANPLGPEYFEPYRPRGPARGRRFYSDRYGDWEVVGRWGEIRPWPPYYLGSGRIERNLGTRDFLDWLWMQGP